MVTVNPVCYEPVGDELNGQVAILQAASALDAAVFLAVESKNLDKLMDAIAMWIGIAERLGIDTEEEEGTKSDKPFGFSGRVSVEEEKEVNEDE